MLKNASYIYDNIIIADEKNTTKKHCKKAQVGVDLTIKNLLKLENAGFVSKNSTYVSNYTQLNPTIQSICIDKQSLKFNGWFIPQGSYIVELNEGCSFGSNDTGYIIMRSSLNRNATSVQSAVWDPGYTSKEKDIIRPMSVRLTVDTPNGIYLEKNARIAQLIVFENEDTEKYKGQFQGGYQRAK